MKVAICDGHGMEKNNETPGKRTPIFADGTKSETGNFMYENEFNRAVAKYLDEILKRCGFETLMVAPTDVDVSLKDRVNLANANKADFYISIHANAFGSAFNTAKGIETFHFKNSVEGKKAATSIHKYLMQGIKLTDRGVKESADLYVLKYTNMPSVLVECGFMTNIDEAKLLLSDSYRKECAEEIAKGICEYFNISFIEEKKEEVNLAYNTIAKERIYASNGKLVVCTGNYKVKATDIRHIKFQTGKVRYKFVYEKGAKVSSLVKKHGALFGFNAPFFYNGVPLGDTEDQDKVISAAYGKMLKWHEFAVVDGKPIIGQLDKNNTQDLLIQGAPLLVENGQAVYNMYTAIQEVNDDIAKSKCQRTFLWVDKNGDLNLGIADGRTTYDQGLTLQEMALYAISKGATFALNFDGGGSTILADKTGGLNQSLNTGANERVVHHAVLVFMEEEPVISPKETISVTKTEVDTTNSKTNEKKVIDGFIFEGSTYVKMRDVAEFLEAQVVWDDNLKRPGIIK